MNFHFLLNSGMLNVKQLSHLSNQINDSGYDSLLLTYHSLSPDYWIKSAAALNTDHKFKYMIALRPFNMSYQHFAMMVEGFNQIQKNRLIINFIAGDFHNRSDEDKQSDVYGLFDSIDTIEKRKTIVRDFVDNYKKHPLHIDPPKFVFSGYSKYMIETAEMFNGTTLCMLDDYYKNIELFKNIKNKMVSVLLVIRDTEELAEKEAKEMLNERQLESSVAQKMLNLSKDGITDILVSAYSGSSHIDNESISRIHECIRRIKNV
jgi:alkanesulfonate monooxygenase SsuD/methylene tetrahydromethanopterin reductase-like flavin-dependent oxidoreductase (luciferase family)